jgi:two-component system alkaline phosphatase synthesis response regulator PhoP
MKPLILLVEDEPAVAMIVCDLLRSEGYRVETAPDGPSGLRKASEQDFDLLILDVMLPGADGLEVCQAVREQGFDGAILMLTAKGEVLDRVQGLRKGADDYQVKPFDSDELLARVDALLRRTRNAELTPVTQFEFGQVWIDFSKGSFYRRNRPFAMTAKEMELLRYLINHRGRVVSRENILKHVWKDQAFITPRTVDVHVAWLRKKVEEEPQSPRHIVTVRGEGYRFVK